MRGHSIVALALFAVVAGPAHAQQDLCFHKVRHVTCHFADGKTVAYDTDATAEFYNTRPAITFRTADGNLHSVFGNCEVTCHP